MIVGLGLDVVSVDGFARQLEAEQSSFAAETFTAAERRYAEDEAKGRPAEHLAVRFAAKEAALKALDQAAALAGVEPSAVPLKQIEVLRDHRGRPALALYGEADQLANAVGADRALITLSHDGDAAVAVVIFERLPSLLPEAADR